jgi:hypothetical protein
MRGGCPFLIVPPENRDTISGNSQDGRRKQRPRDSDEFRSSLFSWGRHT